MSWATTTMPATKERGLRDALAVSPRLARAATILAVAEAGQQYWQKAHTKWREHRTFTVVVREGDPVYRSVHAWLVGQIPDEEHKNLLVGADGTWTLQPVDEIGGQAEPPQIRVMINDESQHRLTVNGHKVTVVIAKPDATAAAGEKASSVLRRPEEVRFEARTQAGQQAVIEQIAELHRQAIQRQPALRMVTQWGSWRTRSDVPTRSMESVILPPDQKARIRDDLATFLASEERYVRLGIPYHRGYAFHGPPGTGKTSLVKALAGEFHLDLWYIPLGDLTDEASLMSLISEVSARSILLLEDIDTVHAASDREQKTGPGITTASLLNALDGVATPHGLITVMTTNHFDRLDPALTRAGRMDRIEEIVLPTREQVARLVSYFYGTDVDHLHVLRLLEATSGDPISHAEVAEVLKRHMDDSTAGVEALCLAHAEVPAE